MEETKQPLVEIIKQEQTPYCEPFANEMHGLLEFDAEVDAIVNWCDEQPNAIGVAFNQVMYKGKRSSIRAFYDKRNKKVYFNPQIVSKAGMTYDTKEYCLTWPGITLKANRNVEIVLKYENEKQEKFTETFEGTKAHLIQHEVDHLDGVKEDFYTNEKIEKPTVGRNDQCPCGSGKKFKKCCINKMSQYHDR